MSRLSASSREFSLADVWKEEMNSPARSSFVAVRLCSTDSHHPTGELCLRFQRKRIAPVVRGEPTLYHKLWKNPHIHDARLTFKTAPGMVGDRYPYLD